MSQANDFHRTIDDTQRELQALQEALADHERTLTRLRGEIAEREQEIIGLKDSSIQVPPSTGASAEHKPEPAAPTVPFAVTSPADFDYKIALALTLANVSYNALFVVDADCRIIAINDTAEVLFGRQRPIGELLDEVTGIPELNMMVMDALTNQEDTFEEQMTIDRRFYRAQTKVIHRDGHLFIGIALQDVSELVRLNRARRDMVANISHELRTPIANVRLIIESLFHEQEKPKRKQSTSALRAIARETDSLMWLVQELLDLSMIESGQAILRMVEQPLRRLVLDSIERLEDQSATKDVALLDETPEGIQVLVDGDHVRRVLVNLMHNAIKWSSPGQVVKVRAAVVDDEVVVSVLDRGPGVPEDQRERIFERFYQIDSSRSSKEGTGLGLAICRHIVQAHGGRIWVENNPETTDGHGGCFLFTIPYAGIMADAPLDEVL